MANKRPYHLTESPPIYGMSLAMEKISGLTSHIIKFKIIVQLFWEANVQI